MKFPRLALAVLVALAACAGSGTTRTDLIVLESHQFTWGAAAGLGWGSRLAPVLASLEEIPGVREARVHHDGVYFLFALEPDAAAFDVLEGARELLPDARRPPSATETELVGSYLRGETWLRSTHTVELSREEAHILAKRHAEQAAAAIGLDDAERAKLLGILDEETVAAFDRVHAQGGGLGPGSRLEFEAGARRTVERCKAFLDAREVARLEEYLTRMLSR